MVQGGLAHSGVVCHDLSWFGMVRSTWSDGVAVGNASRFFEVIIFSRASRSLAKTGFFLRSHWLLKYGSIAKLFLSPLGSFFVPHVGPMLGAFSNFFRS